ncbi:MAG: ATP-grasp domain-containing protein [Deltaproteobacteria bacterium]|nr:ATP-grasp domain-containing protein [Deltaproteobacteria bacterium]
MKIAFTHNLRLTDSEEEAEFDTAETVDAIASALASAGHEVEKIEVSGPASHLVSRLEASDPDLIFNTAEGRRGRAREAFYPALFGELGFPYTGSDAYVLTLTLDKWLTKLVLNAHGVDSPRSRLVSPNELSRISDSGIGLSFPVIVKPNYEGSSKGIGDEAVARDPRGLVALLKQSLSSYPAGVLVEEFIPGSDVSVGFLAGVEGDGILAPVEYVVDPVARNRYNIYDYRLKNVSPSYVHVRCPADISRDVAARLRVISRTVFTSLGIRDVGRIDFRLGDDGRIYLLEVNALPSLERGAGLFAGAAHAGLSYDMAISAIVKSAALRWKLATPLELGTASRKKSQQVRVGFTYNMKRVDSKAGDDAEAEYDPPETISAISDGLAHHGHAVVHLEATPDLPRLLAESNVDLVFNIAEGLVGRNREAQVPALCELLGIPYTGSDSATLAIALDKALTKKVLKQHDILTPEFQLFETGRERLSPTLRFPVIVKPNAEGSSKGIAGTSVVDDETGMRAAVRALIEKYRQPALVEEYIPGREFTIGLLGDRRPRVLPPMEICFKDRAITRPVYDFQVKQEWEKHVEYRCPAPVTPAELKVLERAARETFSALDCRDVARVDVKMNPQGQVYVLEVNPLPGLTPDYSDLVLIARAAGIDYRTLIGEILAGGLKRMREKRRGLAEQRAGDKNVPEKAGDKAADRTDRTEKTNGQATPVTSAGGS